jgi:hypothetical protein
MTISDSKLDYENHIASFKNFRFLTGDPTNDRHWICQAQDRHALSATDAALELLLDVVSLGQQVNNAHAKTQLVFGAARRLKFIWISFRSLYASIAPNRTDPLPIEEAETAARDLNDIYIHLRGCMDNYAWALRYLFGDDALRKFDAQQMHLFGNGFLKNPSMKDFSSILNDFMEWNKQLKALRDPVAHRIPLSVTRAAHTQGDRSQYERVEAQYLDAQKKFSEKARAQAPRAEIDAASERADALYDKLQRIGTFVPFIVHDPDEGSTSIYPTVPQDIGMFVKLARALNWKIREKLEIAK